MSLLSLQVITWLPALQERTSLPALQARTSLPTLLMGTSVLALQARTYLSALLIGTSLPGGQGVTFPLGEVSPSGGQAEVFSPRWLGATFSFGWQGMTSPSVEIIFSPWGQSVTGGQRQKSPSGGQRDHLEGRRERLSLPSWRGYHSLPCGWGCPSLLSTSPKRKRRQNTTQQVCVTCWNKKAPAWSKKSGAHCSLLSEGNWQHSYNVTLNLTNQFIF